MESTRRGGTHHRQVLTAQFTRLPCVQGSSAMLIRLLVTAFFAGTLVACATSVPQPSAGTPRPLPSPPPAVSAIDHTVSIGWQLADSFDVTPNGSCRGRSAFINMGAGLRVQLRGRTTGLTDETRATARVEDHTIGRSARWDDGLYCVIRIVFAPAVPDPDGYWLRFPASQQPDVELRALNRGVGPIFSRGEPVEQPTLPAGYGLYNSGSQSCPSPLDPPDRDCPTAMG